MMLKLYLDLPDDGACVPLTRQFGHGPLEYLKVVREGIGDAETIVTVPVTNAVRHARSADGRFQAVLEYYAECGVITVVDAGHGFAFRGVPEVGSPRPGAEGGERLGGFGLPLLELMLNELDLGR